MFSLVSYVKVSVCLELCIVIPIVFLWSPIYVYMYYVFVLLVCIYIYIYTYTHTHTHMYYVFVLLVMYSKREDFLRGQGLSSQELLGGLLLLYC